MSRRNSRRISSALSACATAPIDRRMCSESIRTRSVRSEEMRSPCAHSLRASHRAETARLSSKDSASLNSPCHCLSNTQNRYAGSDWLGVAPRPVKPAVRPTSAAQLSPNFACRAVIIHGPSPSATRSRARPTRSLLVSAAMSEQPFRSHVPVATKPNQLCPRANQGVIPLLIGSPGLSRRDAVKAVCELHRRVLQRPKSCHQPCRL